MKLVKLAGVFFTAARQLFAENAMSHAAAVAFYAALGLAPTMLLFVSLSAALGQDAQEGLYREIGKLVGPRAVEPIRAIIENADESKRGSWISTVISLGTVLFSASAIFVQLRNALNTVWNVQLRADASNWAWLRKRLITLVMAPAVFLLLMASIVATSTVSLLAAENAWLLRSASFLISLLLYAAVFGLMFKTLPDAKISWRDVLVGSLVTAALFALGRHAIGLYLGRFAVGNAYGAAGSLIALLTWVYYSAIVFLYGAEITQVWSREFGKGIRPSRSAQHIGA